MSDQRDACTCVAEDCCNKAGQAAADRSLPDDIRWTRRALCLSLFALGYGWFRAQKLSGVTDESLAWCKASVKEHEVMSKRTPVN